MERHLKLSLLVLGTIVSGVGAGSCLVELALRGGLVYHSPDSSLGGDSVYYGKEGNEGRGYKGVEFECDDELMWV